MRYGIIINGEITLKLDIEENSMRKNSFYLQLFIFFLILTLFSCNKNKKDEMNIEKRDIIKIQYNDRELITRPWLEMLKAQYTVLDSLPEVKYFKNKPFKYLIDSLNKKYPIFGDIINTNSTDKKYFESPRYFAINLYKDSIYAYGILIFLPIYVYKQLPVDSITFDFLLTQKDYKIYVFKENMIERKERLENYFKEQKKHGKSRDRDIKAFDSLTKARRELRH